MLIILKIRERSMSDVKLTYDEYMKASEAGLISGHACACIGRMGNDEFCGCRMSILDKLTPEGSAKMASEWRVKYPVEKTPEEILKNLNPNRLP